MLSVLMMAVADPETSERGGPRNVKYKPPRVAAIFLAYFLQARGGMAPLPSPGSATGWGLQIVKILTRYLG